MPCSHSQGMACRSCADFCRIALIESENLPLIPIVEDCGYFTKECRLNCIARPTTFSSMIEILGVTSAIAGLIATVPTFWRWGVRFVCFVIAKIATFTDKPDPSPPKGSVAPERAAILYDADASAVTGAFVAPAVCG